jgi:hypothetical protein
MTTSGENPAPPLAEGKKPSGRRMWLLWILGGAFLGAVVGLYLMPGTEGFYHGALLGAVIEAALVVVVNTIFGGRQGTLLVSGVAVACGVAAGTLASIVLRPNDANLSLAVLGLIVGVVDAIVAWVLFPGGAEQPPGEEEPAEEDGNYES